MLPDGWKEEKINSVTEKVGSGITPKGGSAIYKKQGIQFLRSQNIQWGKLSLDDVAFIDLKQHIKMKQTSVKNGDVLLNITGASIGRAAAYNIHKEANVNQHVCIIRSNKNIDHNFLVNFLISPYGQKQIDQLQAGGNRQGLNFEQIKSLKILVPPLSEQKKIAAILSTWDRAIEGTEKLLANSQQQKKALMQQLLTGKKRLPGFTGEWEKHRLANCCHVVMGSSPKSEYYNETGNGLPLLQGNADIKNRKSFPRIFTSEITKECQMGDILLSVRAPVGTVSMAVHHACIGRGISSIRVKKNHSQDFLYQYFLSIEGRWGNLAQGSTFEAVNGDDIKKLSILLPPLPEQKAIAAVLTTADEEIAAIESDLSRLRDEKKALMQQLLTGKRRVKVNQKISDTGL